MNRHVLLFAALFLMVPAFLVGGFNGASLLGVAAAVTYIILTIHAAPGKDQS